MRIHVCTSCSKVSVAIRKPKSHKRGVIEGEPEYNPDLNENDGYSHINGFDPGFHYVDCGPFETYIAIPESELTGVFTMGV